MRKRLLSLLLVLACVLTLAVVPVVAAEPDPVQPTASVTEPTPTTDPEPSPEPSSEPSPEPTPEPSPDAIRPVVSGGAGFCLQSPYPARRSQRQHDAE